MPYILYGREGVNLVAIPTEIVIFEIQFVCNNLIYKEADDCKI